MATAVINGAHQHMSNGGNRTSVADDPFFTIHSEAPLSQSHPHPHRYSAFGTQLLGINASSSPSQVKRTLEAHLAETDRRLQDTSKLGIALVQQQKELSEKLKEVEEQQGEGEISSELRQRLAELEREHNDIGKEITKALLAPKSRTVSADEKQPSGGPDTLSSQATASPSKVTAPSRRQRNQPSSRAGDIQFAADISTSLLIQVRQLQAALAERDEALKTVNVEISRLEQDAEGFAQRLRALDESEQRYKDENWNLETHTHELIASSREAADREKKLNVGLAAALAEKSKAQNDLDEVKLAHGKLAEDHAASQKSFDSELHTLRRAVDVGDTERLSLQGKIEELTSQNQELAKAMASRYREQERMDERDTASEQESSSKDVVTPESSPPPSPTKATPRHGGLESETLKSSLTHAHRMIQNLKGNIHREKTEKIELKRMLQDARDELEQRRAEGSGLGSGSKRQKTRSEIFKKPVRPDMLGASRTSRTEVDIDEQEWEDHAAGSTPSHANTYKHLSFSQDSMNGNSADLSDAYHTANDTEGAFETAHEKDTTESEDFQTGVESLAGDSSDELTETEDRVERNGTVRGLKSSFLALKNPSYRDSFMSTASTSAGEDEDDIQTTVQKQPQKYRLKIGRNSAARLRRSQIEPTSNSHLATTKDSPASFLSTASPVVGEQSLFAELGELNGMGSDGEFSTPGRESAFSQKSTPSLATPSLPPRSSQRKVAVSNPISQPAVTMVDSATMTEPWLKDVPSKGMLGNPVATVPGAIVASTMKDRRESLAELSIRSPSNLPTPPSNQFSLLSKDSGTQYTPQKGLPGTPSRSLPTFITPPKTVWDEAHDLENNNLQAELGQRNHSRSMAPMGFSTVLAQNTEPIRPNSTETTPVHSLLSFSSIHTQESFPLAPTSTESTTMLLDEKNDAVNSENTPKTAEKIAAGAGMGLFGAVGAALGFNTARGTSEPSGVEDETTKTVSSVTQVTGASNIPLQEASGSVETSVAQPINQPESGLANHLLVTSSDSEQGSKAGVSSEQTDKVLMEENALSPSLSASEKTTSTRLSPQPATVMPPVSPARSRDRPIPGEESLSREASTPAQASTKHSPSINSLRSLVTTPRPPLPADHRTAIAKAGGRLNISTGESSIGGVMGPPIAPASAYRRPKTPQNPTSPTHGGTTPRASNRYRGEGRLSHRSSVSSFASELDERFNIRTEGMASSKGYGVGTGTDPRMIQAITQTMIGEFLWKYTRKPGRSEMSSTRHSRYFWVHPYTRTLYWSDQDPQSAGRSELKAKSVAIESVRVVTDDNPMPPGLHRKSLEITTPGRKVKFTAATGQRHETWFNALSYLLMRQQEENGAAVAGSVFDGNGLTSEDVDEFNPGHGRRSLATSNSRLSLSSYNSRTTHGTSVHRDSRMGFRHQAPQGTANTLTQYTSTGRMSSTSQRHEPTARSGPEQEHSLRRGSMSLLSNMFKNSPIMGSVTSAKTAKAGEANITRNEASNGSIYDASVVEDAGKDSGELLRKATQKQDNDVGRLENVRACCDGKHDVSSLARDGRRSHSQHRHQSLDRLSHSLSKRH